MKWSSSKKVLWNLHTTRRKGSLPFEFLFRNSGGQEPMRRGIVEEAHGGYKEGKLWNTVIPPEEKTRLVPFSGGVYRRRGKEATRKAILWNTVNPTQVTCDHTLLPFPGGRGVLNKVLYGETPPRGPTPYPFIYHFGRKSTPFIYLLLKKGTPFTYLF